MSKFLTCYRYQQSEPVYFALLLLSKI